MEEIAGMRITRQRPGKKIVKPPSRLTFYNEEGEEILDIHISEYSKEMYIFPRGAEVTIFNYPGTGQLRKRVSKDGYHSVSTNNWMGRELIFPPQEE